MMDLKLWLIVCSMFIFAKSAEKKIVCYYGSWATYRQGNGNCDVKNIDSSLCTHLIYAFVGINEDGTIRVIDPWLELPDNFGRNNFGQFNALKTKNPKLKTMVAIGGWNEGVTKFSKVANDPGLRSKFAKNAAEFTVKYGFNGFDLDWEYPAQRESPNGPKDKDAYTELLKELRKEFDLKGLLLSAAVASVKSSASLSYNIPAMSRYLDFINVMTYDLHGSWDGRTGHNAALHPYVGENLSPADSWSVENAINYWLSEGAPAEKLNLGMPLYGRTFSLANPGQNGLGAPTTGPGIAGQYSGERGMITCGELCEKKLTENWPEIWDSKAEVPYTFKGNDWISYDNERSLKAKVQFALSKNLGGIMLWSVESDDCKNACGKGAFSLMRVINSELGKSPNDIITTTQPPNTTTPPPITTTTKKTTNGDTCTRTGYMRSASDCSKFYYCSQMADGTFIRYSFNCPPGTYYDTNINVCNYANQVDCKM